MSRTRNLVESANKRDLSMSPSDPHYHSQKCDSEKTTHKEMYIRHKYDESIEDDILNEDEVDARSHIFTPTSEKKYKGDTERPIDDSEIKCNNRLENDSSSSPEPLSSRLEGEKMMVYHTDSVHEEESERR